MVIRALTSSSAARSSSPQRSSTAVRTSGTTFSGGCRPRSSMSSRIGATASRASVVSSRPTSICPVSSASTVAARDGMLSTSPNSSP